MPGMPESLGIQGHHYQKGIGHCRRMNDKRLRFSRKLHNPWEVTVKNLSLSLINLTF